MSGDGRDHGATKRGWILPVLLVVLLGMGAYVVYLKAVGRIGGTADRYRGFAFAGFPYTPPRPATDFKLRDLNGHSVSLADFSGKLVLLSFLDVKCTQMCPLTAHTLLQVKRGVGAAYGSKVEIAAISIDPWADAPATDHHFLQKYGIDGQIRFFTGSAATLAPIWKAYGMVVERPKNGGDIVHNENHYLIDDRAGPSQAVIPVHYLAATGWASQAIYDIKGLLGKTG